MSDTYDDYDANQNFKGGMNGYNDDSRYNAETATKTRALIDRAKSNQSNNFGNSAEDLVDRTGNKLEQAQKDLQANTEQAVDYIRDKSENLQDNLSQTSERSKRAFNRAVDDAADTAKNTAKEIKNNLQDLT